jgi:geranylgeranyl diphosphate synthase, type I
VNASLDPGAPDAVAGAVDALIAAHIERLSGELAPLGAACSPLVDALRDAAAGGKRLRATLMYWSWRAHTDHAPAGLDDPTAVLRVGAALELFHAAALVHDDLMDESDTRRGRPSAHRAFESLHRENGLEGDAARFGRSAALLLGDLALAASERELRSAVRDLDGPGDTAQEIFDLMRTEVTAGQYLDVLAEVAPWGSIAEDTERARTVLRAKSARYSVEHPLTLGAALAGASDADAERMRRVGLPLGEAFQLRDDLLGVFGDPVVTGKPAGDDLREGKRTLLVLNALAATDPVSAHKLRTLLGDPDLDGDQVDELRAVIRESGAVDQIEQRIADLADPALAELAESPLADPGRSQLVELGTAAVHRVA